MSNEKAKRFNQGKPMLSLIPESHITGVGEVFTFGAKKYDKHNWRKGMSWSTVLDSAMRHMAAIQRGEDYDPESGLLHVHHLGCNIAILSEYYNIYPQGDDRVKSVYEPKIALDLDGVIFDFDKAYKARFGEEMNPYWKANYSMPEHLAELQKDKDFWVNLEVLNKPPFEPVAYVTTRSIPSEWIEEAIQKNGLPCAPVYTVPWNHSKLETLKSLGDDIIMVDDKYETFKELNNAGIFCYLMDAPHNQYYNVGHQRIKDLNILGYGVK